ncbi:MAG: serine/threonine-protein kinase [Nannocystaceae bacterium]|nr:serine/threonine-protein kinase [Nannocystaceae bacterium]
MSERPTPTTLELRPPPPLTQTRDEGAATPTPAPSCIGRFALVGQLGRGGMGSVYAAWDPRLDRKVAIKLVDDDRFPDPEDARRRLEQEARTAATLNHPNIVTIYDVGLHAGRVFLAMELVGGGTLGAWLQTKRPWPEVVAMFVQVGRGLVAAHAAGLVHRDFKPDNVLIGQDGRPRIADFGLAYSREPPREGMRTTARGREGASATVTPRVMGTPAYMAPEQFEGLPVGPAADQFAFCVALFEALFGRRPFPGNSYQALSTAVCAGELQLPKDTGDVPAALIDVLLRGLEPEPADRFASVELLLQRLERLLGARRRRLTVLAAGLATGIAVAVGFGTAEAVTPRPCENVDALSQRWGTGDRPRVLASLGPSLGGPVVAALDDFTRQLDGKRREVCEATRVLGTQSDEALQLRMACLDRMAARFDGLTHTLGEGGDMSRVDVASVAAQLPSVDPCDDVETLAKLTNRNATRSSRDSVAQDQAWTEAVALVERALTRRMLGRDDAREPAQQAAALAAEHGLFGVRSRALSVLADLEIEGGNPGAAEPLWREAVQLAVADGHDDAAVHLMLDRADAALFADRIDEAELHLAYFDAFFGRMTESDARAQIARTAEIVRARLALAHGDAEAARARLLAIDDAGLAPLDRRAAWMALGTAQRALGQAREAAATWTKLLTLVEAMRGERHVDVAAVLNNLALARLDAGDAREADRLLLRAEDIARAAEGEQSPLLAAIATNRGWAARLDGRFDDAQRQLERSLEIGRATRGARHPAQAFALDQLGELARARHDYPAALEAFAQAGELRDATLGPDHPETATTLLGMGKVLLATGERERAAGALAAALRIVSAHPGPPARREEIEALLERARAPQ